MLIHSVTEGKFDEACCESVNDDDTFPDRLTPAALQLEPHTSQGKHFGIYDLASMML